MIMIKTGDGNVAMSRRGFCQRVELCSPTCVFIRCTIFSAFD